MSKQFEPKQYIHYDPERVDYSVTPHELEDLKNGSKNSAKDFCLVLVPLAISCLLNAAGLITGQPEFKVTLSLFFNSLVGLVCLILGAFFGFQWKRSAKNLEVLVEGIKKKPKMPIVPSAITTGMLPSGSLTFSRISPSASPSASVSPSTSASPSAPDDDDS